MSTISKLCSTASLAAAFTCMGTPASAQDLFVYPSRGQSDEQLAEDRYACHQWAVQESRFDPSEFGELAPPRTVRVPVPENEARGATAKGTVAGAVAGAVIGSREDKANKGAVIGAIIGSIAGSAVEEQGERKAQAQAESEAQRQAAELERTRAEKALRRSDYRRALSACLEGRGYTVK
jgi:outer membrane lipoprotein SlyB